MKADQVAALPGFAKCADGAARLVEIEFQNYSSYHRRDYAGVQSQMCFLGRAFSEIRNRGFAIEARVTVASARRDPKGGESTSGPFFRPVRAERMGSHGPPGGKLRASPPAFKPVKAGQVYSGRLWGLLWGPTMAQHHSSWQSMDIVGQVKPCGLIPQERSVEFGDTW